jgi:hypothetical protein
MEQLILFAVIALISMLFKGKKETDEKPKKPKQQMPPFSNQPAPPKRTPVSTQQQSKPRSLEDFAKDIFTQLEQSAEDAKKSFEKKVAPVVIEETVKVEPEKVQRVAMSEQLEQRSSTRPPLEERPLVKKLNDEAAFNVVPTTQKELMQAIVMAEVLGKPKAKQ